MWKFLSRLFSSLTDSGAEDAVVDDAAAGYDYDHYTDAIEDIKQFKREKRHNEAEELLLWCIDFAESEDQGGLPRWYYKHLGIIYRKDGRYEDEVEILERYIENSTTPREEMRDRLERARELAAGD